MIDENEVFVYRNLHRNKLSVKSVKTNKVIAHVDSIVLVNCKFKVSKKGRERVLKEKRKNVHAGVRGIWIKDKTQSVEGLTRVRYNPYECESFVDSKTNEPVYNSDTVVVTVAGAFI